MYTELYILHHFIQLYIYIKQVQEYTYNIF